ncbi:MAG: hypothetical protein AAGH79_02890 [Bacteroidota bacterium]
MANSLWDYVKNLFQTAEESSPTVPVVHKLIERSQEEKEAYDHWKKTLVRRRLLDWLGDQYAIFLHSPNDIDQALDFLNTPSSKGFVIHLHQTQYSQRDAIFFLDYLKDRVKTLNYRIQISDSRTFNRPNWVETIERHYLKPRSKYQEGEKFKQAFGNILIDLYLRDDRPHHLKLSATIYKDHLFEEAEEFRTLLQMLLTEPD